MATRRRIGVSIATTEAARRQLMQPVACWEKVWTVPEHAPPNSSMKIYKWVKADKKQVSGLKCFIDESNTVINLEAIQ